MGVFEEAVGNFVRNFAYKDSINHLIRRGYTVERIMREKDYPLTREEIEKMIDREAEPGGQNRDR